MAIMLCLTRNRRQEIWMKHALVLQILVLNFLIGTVTCSVYKCGECMCEGSMVTCNFDANQEKYINRNDVQLHEFLRYEPINSPSTVTQLIVNCQNSPAFTATKISRKLLIAFNSLELLKIENCKVTEIHDQAFIAFAPKLKILSLSSNSLITFTDNVFANLKLETLALANNKNINLTASTFKSTILKHLTLSSCNLREFPEQIIASISGLESVTLSDNLIQVVPYSAKRFWDNFMKINLFNNPILCTCVNIWFINLCKQRNHHDMEPICGSPLDLKNRKLKSLIESEIECQGPTIRSVSLTLNSQSVLLRVEGETELLRPIKWWLRNEDFSDAENAGSVYTREIKRRSAFDRSMSMQLTATDQRNRTVDLKLNVTWPKPITISPQPDKTILPTLWPKPEPTPTQMNGEPEASRNIYDGKQFSLVDMIMAVIGTFLTTSVLYLASCQLTRWCRRREKQRWDSYTGAAHPHPHYTATMQQQQQQQQRLHQLQQQQLQQQHQQQQEYDIPRLDQSSLISTLPPPSPLPPPLPQKQQQLQQQQADFLDYSGRRLLTSR